MDEEWLLNGFGIIYFQMIVSLSYFKNLSQMIQFLGQSTVKREFEELSDDGGTEDSDSYK
jgi:hypothetical protein